MREFRVREFRVGVREWNWRFYQSGSERSDRFVPEFWWRSGGFKWDLI